MDWHWLDKDKELPSGKWFNRYGDEVQAPFDDLEMAKIQIKQTWQMIHAFADSNAVLREKVAKLEQMNVILNHRLQKEKLKRMGKFKRKGSRKGKGGRPCSQVRR